MGAAIVVDIEQIQTELVIFTKDASPIDVLEMFLKMLGEEVEVE